MKHDHEAGRPGRPAVPPAEEAGAGACGCCGGGHDHAGELQRSRVWSVAASGLLSALGLVCEWAGAGGEWTPRALQLGAIAAGGWLLAPGAWRALRHLAADMNLLMAIAVAGALALGDWAEAGAVVFLFSLSELLEEVASQRSHRAIRSLMKLVPERALMRQDGRWVEVDAEAVPPGARVAVKSGERIPLDGEVVAGESAVDQAAITGESIPVAKGPGDSVFAGTINGAGSLELLVTHAAGDTTLARIVALVEQAQAARAPAERFVDRFARRYTPLVVAAAVLVATVPPLVAGGLWGDWFYRALVLLVIACPCALVIATPVAVLTALTSLARRGVLVKGGAHLEALGRLRVVALDKTGTITQGRPRLLETHVLASHDERALLQVAAGIEAHSEHPLATAVVAAARERGVGDGRASQFRAHAGRGAEGRSDGHRFFVGNHRLTHELGVCSPAIEARLAGIEAQGRSVVVVGHAPHDRCAGEVLGVLALGDAVRPGAAEAIRALRKAGIRHIAMLSGDNARTAAAVAREAGIDEVVGELLPDGKVAAVRRLLAEHGAVAMVGDGVNDAPALATATVGIAMGAAGSDTALETADVALMNDDLANVATAIRVGRRTVRVIRFNLAFALGVKAAFLALAVSGVSSLWLAILADTGATLLVTGNALRLLRVRE